MGGWTGNAIWLLTPSWSTDVAGDFLAADCAKVVANDAADEIIHDYSSLKSGLSYASEMTRGSTNGVGWMSLAPLEYRMTDHENVGVAEFNTVSYHGCRINPPTWPADKRITLREAFHFAACARRIGKLATAAKRRVMLAQMAASSCDAENPFLSSSPLMRQLSAEGGEEGFEISPSGGLIVPPADGASSSSTPTSATSHGGEGKDATAMIIDAWEALSCCDGLCGLPLGNAVKEGFDCTVSWLCCAVVFGGQIVAENAERRHPGRLTGRSNNDEDMGVNSPSKLRSSGAAVAVVGEEDVVVLPDDFDLRPAGFREHENAVVKHSLPMPVVLAALKNMAKDKSQLEGVEVELLYVIGMLEYTLERLRSKDVVSLALHRRKLGPIDDERGSISAGCFLNLRCGHNNQYSVDERERLMTLITRACGDQV